MGVIQDAIRRKAEQSAAAAAQQAASAASTRAVDPAMQPEYDRITKQLAELEKSSFTRKVFDEQIRQLHEARSALAGGPGSYVGATTALLQHAEHQAAGGSPEGKFIRKVGPVVLGAAFGAALGKIGGAIASNFAADKPPQLTELSLPIAPQPQLREAPMFEGTSFNFSSVLCQGLNSYLQYRLAERQQSMALPVAMPGAPGVTSAAFPSLGGLMSRALPAVGGQVVRSAGRILVAGGRYITKKNAVALAKQLGIQGAATALGIGAVELAQMVIDDQARKRRGGGITAAQMRTTRKTMRKVVGLHRQLVQACSSAGVRRRSSRSCPAPKVIVARK